MSSSSTQDDPDDVEPLKHVYLVPYAESLGGEDLSEADLFQRFVSLF
jgi:hypothetical protein